MNEDNLLQSQGITLRGSPEIPFREGVLSLKSEDVAIVARDFEQVQGSQGVCKKLSSFAPFFGQL